jgi:hypothetical protein
MRRTLSIWNSTGKDEISALEVYLVDIEHEIFLGWSSSLDTKPLVGASLIHITITDVSYLLAPNIIYTTSQHTPYHFRCNILPILFRKTSRA